MTFPASVVTVVKNITSAAVLFCQINRHAEKRHVDSYLRVLFRDY